MHPITQDILNSAEFSSTEPYDLIDAGLIAANVMYGLPDIIDCTLDESGDITLVHKYGNSNLHLRHRG